MNENMGHDNNGVTLSPKASFALGLVGGILVLCTIGFFVLLAIFLKGGMPAGQQQAAAAPTTTTTAPTTNPSPTAAAPTNNTTVGSFRPVDSTDHVRGAKNPKVTLIEYADFQCPYCGEFHPSMVQLMKDYGDKVQWVFRNFPLSFHPNARPAANAAACASDQGDFWNYADALYANQSSLGDAFYTQLAQKQGLNMTKFNDCYKNKTHDSQIMAEEADGSAAGITGTPGTILIAADGSKQLIPGAIPYAQLKAMVDAALAK